MKIGIFYHCLFFLGDPPALQFKAVETIGEQMDDLCRSGLENAAAEIHVGVNGGLESEHLARVMLPQNSEILMHGLQCRNEIRTLLALQEWLPGHDDWFVLYFHAKGSTKPNPHNDTWRACMMRHCIRDWRTCVTDLANGCDAVGCHWMEPPATPAGQRIFAGTFWWAKASYLLTIPPITTRPRIKVSGIDSIESRYESEVFIGNGARKPKIKDYHGPDWNPSKIATCQQFL